jgi:hypothetical protein
MSANKLIELSKISNGQYTVTIDLGIIPNSERRDFRHNIKELRKDCEGDTRKIYKLKGNEFSYTSETLFPHGRYVKKPKVLIVFGNPAFHSIKNGMFFFSRANNQRHGMWGKLQKAKLIKPVRFDDSDLLLARTREAEERKNLISKGQASEEYCLGLTTFYSFPTPVEGSFRDVQGAEKLFKPILENRIIPFEVGRILKYPFTKNAILVFVQKSSYEAFKRHSEQDALFWPVRGENSSGEDLSQMLKEKINA